MNGQGSNKKRNLIQIMNTSRTMQVDEPPAIQNNILKVELMEEDTKNNSMETVEIENNKEPKTAMNFQEELSFML